MSTNLHRPYQSTDLDACLRLFDSNTPHYFDPSERELFVRYLGRSTQPFFVIERDGVIVACGGYAVESDGVTASLTWGMVERSLHGQGLGQALTAVRLAAIRALPQLCQVEINTSQHTQRFYARFGFETVKVTPDGYGPGIDRWDMLLPLTPPAQEPS